MKHFFSATTSIRKIDLTKAVITCASAILASVVGGIVVQPASAATIVSTFLSGNDCAGVFGRGFSNCNVLGPTGTKFSPVIAKFNDSLNSPEINSTLYPSVDGSEWSFSGLGAGNGTGTWTYTPGANDPAIKYWVAKAGNGFNLFWTVNTAETQTGGACFGSVYTDACLGKALPVTTGTWTTPLNNQNRPRGLSHITFYNAKTHGSIPEPSLVFGLGMVAVGAVVRRKGQQP